MRRRKELAKMQDRIEKRLDELTKDVGALQPELGEAVRYSLLNAGKRIRPWLTLTFCHASGGNAEDALDCACAVEMIHTYSLIHDDLPCMDDDDMRRGKPSCHCVYGEAVALLAGDALQMLALETIASSGTMTAQMRADACAQLARLSGAAGMVGGQMIDIFSEGKSVDIHTLERMYAGKTCALIESACVMGCICAGAPELAENARRYAHGIGMAFQITDDILDITADEATLGKPVNSDIGNNKSTFVSLLGLDEAAAQAERYTQAAVEALEPFGENAGELRDFAWELLRRNK